MTTKVKRRLTSILCADVKSYARLMESDETRTIGMLRAYRTAMDALIERHDGRTINTWGDAVIAEFSSVVEAVQCAIEIQRELGVRNRDLPEPEQMWFRIRTRRNDGAAPYSCATDRSTRGRVPSSAGTERARSIPTARRAWRKRNRCSGSPCSAPHRPRTALRRNGNFL